VSKKDDRIVIIVGDDLKKEFKKACDGRTMSHVICKFIKNYIDEKKRNE